MTAALARTIGRTWSLLRFRELALKVSRCPLCGPTLLVKLAQNSISLRCVRCRASAIHMSIVQVLHGLYPDLSGIAVYEMSSRGALFEYLKRRAGRLTVSEFFDDVAPGD